MAPVEQPGSRPAPATASLWRPGGLTLRRLAGRVYDRAWEHAILDRAAILSYYFLFALFPALLFLTALLGLLPTPNLMPQLMGYAARVMPRSAAALVIRTLEEVVQGASGGLLSIGGVAALWAASSGMASIMAALDAVGGIADQRSWWRRRLTAVGLTLAFALFTLTALLLLFFGIRIGEIVAASIGKGPLFTLAWNVLQWPVLVLLVLGGITLVYHLAPARARPWHWVTPGSAFAVLAWLAMSYGLRLYVRYLGNYNATYGSIGGVILLMLWLYLSGVVLLLGAAIDSELERAGAPARPEAKATAGAEAPPGT